MPLSDDTTFPCPYCGSENSLSVDFSAGRRQKMLTDCETCCSPLVVHLEIDNGEVVYCDAVRENG